MCQIIQGPSAQVKSVLLNTAGLLEELHKNNPDGWGAMYHTTKGTKAIKKLPRSAADTRALIKKLPGDDRPVALHWRWKTSGLVDTGNAHPHHVHGGWLIHNGVLDVDMAADRDRCDTYHFARAYLDHAVHCITGSERLQSMLGEFIGDNRFVLMDDAGVMVIINKDQGYMAQGLWFANTYSMSRSLVDPSYKPSTRYAYGWHRSKAADFDLADLADLADPFERDWRGMGRPAVYDETAHEGIATAPLYSFEPELFGAVEDCDTDTLAELLEEDAVGVLTTVFDTYRMTHYKRAGDETLTDYVIGIREALCAKNKKALLELLRKDTKGYMATAIAETLLWYCDLTETINT